MNAVIEQYFMKPLAENILKSIRKEYEFLGTWGNPQGWTPSQRVRRIFGQLHDGGDASGSPFTLIRTGELISSLEYSFGDDEIIFGTDIEYAPDMQYGVKDRNVPARPFLFFNDAIDDDIEKAFFDWCNHIMEFKQ